MLEGKSVVITGSGRGIGAAYAKGAARQGASVVVNDVDGDLAEQVAAEIRSERGSAIACVADISAWEEAGRLIDACVDEFGRIDGLVNNAGLFHLAKLVDFDPVAARALIEVNVMGTLNCAARAVKPMLAQGGGSIVNVTSGSQMGLDSMGVYGASKGAAASMVYTWALELKGTGVRVNAISPLAATRMTALNDEYFGVAKAGDAPRHQAPEVNSPVVEFLLSDRAEGVSGQVVRIDNGNLQLCTHPAVLLPPLHRERWTAEEVANAFDSGLRDRLVPSGVRSMKEGPVRGSRNTTSE